MKTVGDWLVLIGIVAFLAGAAAQFGWPVLLMLGGVVVTVAGMVTA